MDRKYQGCRSGRDLPVRDYTVHDVDLPFVGWIPDFQHLRLPELFDPAEIGFRDKFFSAIAQKSGLILLSSESARMDFEEFFPGQAAKARVAHFPSLLWTLDRRDDSATSSEVSLAAEVCAGREPVLAAQEPPHSPTGTRAS